MLIEDLQLLLNRRMRTRMYGGVGAAVSNGGGYPISSFCSFAAPESLLAENIDENSHK